MKATNEPNRKEEGEIRIETPRVPPIEKSNSLSKRYLECAGNVEEKCHPNPKAKRCKLEDIVLYEVIYDRVVK